MTAAGPGISVAEFKERFESAPYLRRAVERLRAAGVEVVAFRVAPDERGKPAKKPVAGIEGQRKAQRRVAPSAEASHFDGSALPGVRPGSVGLVTLDVDGLVVDGERLPGEVSAADLKTVFSPWGAVLVRRSWSGKGWHVTARLPADVDPMDVQIGLWELEEGGVRLFGEVCCVWRWAALADLDAVQLLAAKVETDALPVVPVSARHVLFKASVGPDMFQQPAAKPEPAAPVAAKSNDAAARRREAYVAGAVEKVVGLVSSCREGARNNTLNREAWGLYAFVLSGDLSRSAWESAMKGAASSAGSPSGEIVGTLQSVVESPPDAWDGVIPDRPWPGGKVRAASVSEPVKDVPPVEDEAEAEGEEESLVVPIQFDAPAPDVLLQRHHDGPDLQAVLVRGDVAVLTGPGKQGKSTIIAGLMLAAGMADGGQAFGFDVAPGKALLVSMEDIPWSVAKMYGYYGDADAFAHVGELRRPVGRLWEVSPNGSQAGASWLVMEKAIEEFQPTYLVVDTVAHAFPAASPETVAEFIGNLRSLAARLNVGVLLVAHCTKSAQRRLAEGETWIDDSIVAGGAQWLYSPRAVLVVHKVGKPFRESMGADTVLVRCHYSNIGKPGWGVATGPRYGADGGYRGLDLDPTQEFDDVEEYLDRLTKDKGAGAGVRAERLEALAGKVAAFCRPLACPGAVAASNALRLAYVGHANEAVNPNDFAEAMSLAGYVRGRSSRGSVWADLQLPGAS